MVRLFVLCISFLLLNTSWVLSQDSASAPVVTADTSLSDSLPSRSVHPDSSRALSSPDTTGSSLKENVLYWWDYLLWISGGVISLIAGIAGFVQIKDYLEKRKRIAELEEKEQLALQAKQKEAEEKKKKFKREYPFWVEAQRRSETSTSSTEVEIIKIINEQFLGILDSELQFEAGNSLNPWKEAIVKSRKSLKSFVQPLPDRNDATMGIIELILEYLNSTKDGEALDSVKIWLVGGPGTGKTTLMTKLFLELIHSSKQPDTIKDNTIADSGSTHAEKTRERPTCIPILLRPDIMDPAQISKINEFTDKDQQFRAFIDIWFNNRNVSIPADELDNFIRNLKQGLQTGTFIFLLDGFDELQRYDLGQKSYHNFLNIAKYWVASGRLQADDITDSGVKDIIPIPGKWTNELISQHLKKRWTSRADWIPPILKTLENTEQDHWCRIPVYLNLLLNEIETQYADGIPGKEFLQDLLKGQNKLFEKIWDRAIERLSKISGLTSFTSDQLQFKLAEFAAEEFKEGKFSIAGEEGTLEEEGTAWPSLKSATEIVVIDHLKSQGQFVTDFMRDFFLSLKLAIHFEERDFGEDFNVIFSAEEENKFLLPGISFWLTKRGYTDDILWKVIDGQSKREEDRDPEPTETHSPSSAYVLELIAHMKIAKLQKEYQGASTKALRRQTEFKGSKLNKLNLKGVDLRYYCFKGVNFDDSHLTASDLQYAKFIGCYFINTDLSQADARGAEFQKCTFRDRDNLPKQLSVDHFRIEKEGIDNLKPEDWAHIDTSRSRYHGEFGRLFFGAQAGFLGPGYPLLENGYTHKIQTAIKEAREDVIYEGEPIYLVDLMAGGSNERLKRILGITDNKEQCEDLNILAIDRNLHQLRDVLEHQPKGFRALQHEIRGFFENGVDESQPGLDLDITAALQNEFDSHLDYANIIIAKKAIHELPRELQPRFIRECFDSLKPGGKFILFADSPVMPVSEERYRELMEIKDRLRQVASEKLDITTIREQLLGIDFGSSQEEAAFFCNLWVGLKDWTNNNLRELQQRYFSSAHEIISWSKQAGFSDPINTVTGHYTLAAPKFNELGIQKVANHLERYGPEVVEKEDEKTKMSDWLYGRGMDKLNLLIDFTEYHLQKGQSELGKILVDQQNPEINIDFSSIDPIFGEIQQPRQAVAYHFPVHVLEFEKPK